MERKPATLRGSRSPEGGGDNYALGNSAEISNNVAQSIELPAEINCDTISKDSGVVCGGVKTERRQVLMRVAAVKKVGVRRQQQRNGSNRKWKRLRKGQCKSVS